MVLNRRAQSTLEYAVIIAVVVAGLIAMQAYMKRGLQGKLRQASDEIGEQYSPGKTTGTTTTQSSVTSTESVTVSGGQPTTTSSNSSTQTRTHSENVGGESSEDWGK